MANDHNRTKNIIMLHIHVFTQYEKSNKLENIDHKHTKTQNKHTITGTKFKKYPHNPHINKWK